MNLKLLLVEDDEIYEKFVRRILEPYHGPGAFIDQIHHAPTMQQALDELRRHDFDLVILDLGLPDSTRRQTMDMIPVIKLHQPKAAVLVVTGGADARDEALERGANGFMDKLTTAEHRAMLTALKAVMLDKHASARTNAELVARIADV